jgi:SAM-dependent methyltransferase
VLNVLTRVPLFLKYARGAADWTDLQWSLLITQLTWVAPKARGRLLDVGCGSKPYEHIFRPFVTEYVGVEHQATFERTAASGVGGPDFLYDGRRLPFDDRSFDTVLSVQVLEHTPEPALLVSEMARVLKDDGLLVLSAPFQFRLHEKPHDYFRYTPYGLRALCERVELEVVEIQNQGSLWTVLAHKLNSYLAFNVVKLAGFAQAMGKLSHESPVESHARPWLLPFVAPAMLGLSGAARVLDRWLPEPDEALGFLVVARRARRR